MNNDRLLLITGILCRTSSKWRNENTVNYRNSCITGKNWVDHADLLGIMLSRGDSQDALSSNHCISQDWLEAVLRKYYSEDGKTATVKINSLSSKEGCDPVESVLSDILALSVDADINGEKATLHFIIKLLPLDPFSRYFVAESQFDLREIKFYTQVRGSKSCTPTGILQYLSFADCSRVGYLPKAVPDERLSADHPPDTEMLLRQIPLDG